MFATNRSLATVLLPLAMLFAVAWWTNRGGTPAATAAGATAKTQTTAPDQPVAASLASR